MVLLLLPLYAIELGVSIMGVGSLVAFRNAGTLIMDLPAGYAIHSFGEKKLTLMSMLLIVVACLGIYLSKTWYGMVLFILLFGVGIGGVHLARHCFVSEQVANHKRARGLTKLVILQRAGLFIGPMMGGVIGEYFGYQTAFLVAIFISLAALIICLCYLPKPQQVSEQKTPRDLHVTFSELYKHHRKNIVAAVIFVMILRLVRTARQLLLPLWGHHIGLSVAEIGLIFGLSSMMEVSLLYFGGQISDQWGRKWSAIPCIALLSISLLLIPFALDFFSYSILAILSGAANGLGGGIIMLLGADLAPTDNRSTFLGAWRLAGDFSGILSPILVGTIGSTIALSGAAVVSGGFGVLGSVVMLLWVKETLVSRDSKQLLNR